MVSAGSSLIQCGSVQFEHILSIFESNGGATENNIDLVYIIAFHSPWLCHVPDNILRHFRHFERILWDIFGMDINSHNVANRLSQSSDLKDSLS